MKLRTKLIAGFGATLIFLVMLAAMSVIYARRAEMFLRISDLKGMELYNTESTQAAVMAELLVLGRLISFPDEVSLNEAKSVRENASIRLNTLKVNFDLERDLIAGGGGTSALHLQWDKLKKMHEKMETHLTRSSEFAVARDRGRARAEYQSALKLFDEGFSKDLSSLTDHVTMETLDVLDAMLKSIADLRSRLIYFVLTMALLIVVFAGYMVITMTRRFKVLEAATDHVANGTYEPILEMEQGSDELSALGGAFNRMSITLGKRTEQLMDAEEKLITSAKLSALGEMAGGVAHEINTPLCTIKLLSEQVQELLAENSPDLALVSQMCGSISSTATRAAQIIDGLRTFSRDGSRDQFKRAPVADIIASTLSLCSEKLKNHEVDLRFERPPGDWMIQCREVQISQIILNLVSNACDAIQELDEKWISIDAVESGDRILIRVTDSGNGIPEPVRNKIFQPFFTTKEVGKGTGLGLSVSAGIAKAHQGDLSVDASHPHTRFVLNLPRA